MGPATRALGATAATFIALLSWGCFSEGSTLGAACETNAGCGDGQRCITGTCKNGPCAGIEPIQLPNDVSVDYGHLPFPLSNEIETSCGPENTPEVVYRWTAPEAGRYVVRPDVSRDFWTWWTQGSPWELDPFLPVTTILKGGCDGEEIGCFPSDPIGTVAQTIPRDFALEEGQEVTIVVDDLDPHIAWDDPLHGYRIRIDRADCDATPIFGITAPVPDNTQGETDKIRPGRCEGLPWLGGGGDKIYEFTAFEAGEYAFETKIDLSDPQWDTVLYLVEGNCGGSVVACNDDRGEALTSAVTADLVADETVLVVVDGNGKGDEGNFTLRITKSDECAEEELTEIPAPPDGVPGTADTLNEIDTCKLVEDQPEKLYSFTASAAQFYTFSSDPPAILSVIRDNCVGDLSCDWSDERPAEPAHMNDGELPMLLAANETVIIGVAPIGGQTDFTLSMDLDECPLDDNRIVLGPEGVSGNMTGKFDAFRAVGSTTCQWRAGDGAPDVAHRFHADVEGTYEIGAFRFRGNDVVNPVLYVLDHDCVGPLLACEDEGKRLPLLVELDSGDDIVVVLDGEDSSSNDDLYQITIERRD